MAPESAAVFIIDAVSSPECFQEALALRFEVFCGEQNVPADLEHDAEDALAWHALVRDADGSVVGTGRVLRMREDGTQDSLHAVARPGDVARIGRMAVRRELRRNGIGERVLKALQREAADAGLARATLHAQCQARRFYNRLGYVEEGALFTEAGIEHVTMTRRL